MIILFTDFGTHDPYVGQVKAKLAEQAPAQQVVDLLHQAPDYNPHAGAHLIAAFAPTFPSGTVFMCVVDPGVGTERDGVVVLAGGRWFVGPDNGLLSIVAARGGTGCKVWRIKWQPEVASTTFHGRDIFAVIAALIANGEFPAEKLAEKARLYVEFDAGDLARVIYIDHFGNAWTGMRGTGLPKTARIIAGDGEFKHAESFGFVGKGEGFWFVNSVGLVELAINRGSAAEKLGLTVGDVLQVFKPH
jgi:S-adenosyl-L-methionine hydrolase (adenosine-forming)